MKKPKASKWRTAVAIGATLMLSTAGVLAIAGPASAHNKSFSVDCAGATGYANAYNNGAHIKITTDTDGTLVDAAIPGGGYTLNHAWSNTNINHTMHVSITGSDNPIYDLEKDYATTGCYKEPTSPKFDYGTYYCDQTDWTVKGNNVLVLSAFSGGAYKIQLGGSSQTVTSFNGAPPYGVGTYTITAFDTDPNDGYLAGSATYTPTFVSDTSVTCQPPDIVVPVQTATDHSCPALGQFTPSATAGVDWTISIDGGPWLPWVGGTTVYGTSDGTSTGTPLDGASIKLHAEKSGKANLSGQTDYTFTFNVPTNCEVTADLTYEIGKCVAPGVKSGNSGDLTGSAGVTFTDSINGAAPTAISAGHYNNGDITPGTHDVVATAPAGYFYHFSGGGKTLVFPQVTFPDTSKLNCDVTVTPDPWSLDDVCGLPDLGSATVHIPADTAILDYEYVVDTVANTVKFTVDVIAFGYVLPNGTTHDEETKSYTDELCVVKAPPAPVGFCNAGLGGGYYSVPSNTTEYTFTDDGKGHVSVAPTAGNAFPAGTQTSWTFRDVGCIEVLAATGSDPRVQAIAALLFIVSGLLWNAWRKSRLTPQAPPAQGV